MSICMAVRAAVAAVAVLFGSAVAATAQSAANVAVVINDASPASIQIGEHYVAQRRVPASNVIRILAPAAETIGRDAYVDSVEGPVAKALTERRLQDRILYIVLTKGVPLRISGRAGAQGEQASVDSELTLLYRRLLGRQVLSTGTIDNPYFAGTRPVGEARPFSRRDHDIYLVTRLDAFTVEDAIALIDRATAPESKGRVLLDRRPGPGGQADLWLVETARALRELGHGDRVQLVEALPAGDTSDPLIGYFSWGSNDPANNKRRLGVRFSAGAVAATLAGTDARTFATPPDSWEPAADVRDRSRVFAQTPHSLVADLIRDGVTGVAGNVADPLLASAVRPEILFPAYLSGFNLVESFYLALPHLSWQSVIVGDPLCRPFAGRAVAGQELEDVLDETTQLPGVFASRRKAVVGERRQGATADTIALIVRAEAQLSVDDQAGARETLRRVVKQAPTLADQHLRLALLDEEAGDFDVAIEGYRRVLELDPRNALALNNLSFRLAVDRRTPAEALPLARRALVLAPSNPQVLDTVGWIEHLLGNHAEAVRILSDAARRDPVSAGIRLHLATVLAASGSHAAAEAHLTEVLRLHPTWESRDDVKELRATLAKKR